MTPQDVAERVARPILASDEAQEAVGLYVGNECRFVIPVGGTERGLAHLLKNVRMVIEEAVKLGA